MPETWYLVAVLVIVFTITVGLRSVPFVVLGPLRGSAFVTAMARWMPAGLLGVLAAGTLLGAAGTGGEHLLPALCAVAVTVLVHLCLGRRTLLSVGAGTTTFLVLVNLF
ncbi:branched-chain amino acid transporter permease [Nocardiopsis sp. MG754419]|uniref:branched-chain amino acid transporter permease n=1 Tax=Nocardiopsis sp. MG754419 TaxID=2259865 RepID=UPI001BAA01E0|nr:AzlD domain-containing protein [Nocardiopsis sp. MG754419]MBR8743229.1 branched-chain amino acid transporter AzlD [Nocardiopsis sp. MG754419]